MLNWFNIEHDLKICKKIRQQKLKTEKTDTGIFIDKEGNNLLDLYTMSYNMEMNRFEVTSRQQGITMCLNMDSVTEFIERNKEVIFNDF